MGSRATRHPRGTDDRATRGIERCFHRESRERGLGSVVFRAVLPSPITGSRKVSSVRSRIPFPALEPVIGETIGHYRILEKLRAGGMGVVYRAEDIRLGRGVALKFLPDELSGDRDAAERFQREARAASALNHPHICTVHDIGEHAGRRFIVMELLEGTALDQLITGRPLPLDQLLELGSEVADALTARHREVVGFWRDQARAAARRAGH